MHRLKAVQTAVVEGNWNVAQHLELIPATGSNLVTLAEMRGAQRVHHDQLRVQQGGEKAMEECRPGRPPGDSAREEERRRLLPAGHPECHGRTGSQVGPQMTAGVPSFSQKGPFASTCANSKVPSSASQSQTSLATSQSASTTSCGHFHGRVTESFDGRRSSSESTPNTGTASRSPLPSRQVALRRASNGQKCQFQEK